MRLCSIRTRQESIIQKSTTKIYTQTRRRNRINSATNEVNIRHGNNTGIIMVKITLTFSITNSYVIGSKLLVQKNTDRFTF